MMLPKFSRPLFGLILASLSFHVSAEFASGIELQRCLEKWERDDDKYSYAIAYCTGYVMGISDSMMGISACPPDTVSTWQIKATVLKQLRETPGKIDLPGSALVFNILKKTWPCPDRQPVAGASPPTRSSPSPQRSVPSPKSKQQDASPF